MIWLEKTDKDFFTSKNVRCEEDLLDLNEEIVSVCELIDGDDIVSIKGFGKNQDLTLAIWKLSDKGYEHLVDIITLKDDDPVDDALSVCIDNDLENELWRIFHYEDFQLVP